MTVNNSTDIIDAAFKKLGLNYTSTRVSRSRNGNLEYTSDSFNEATRIDASIIRYNTNYTFGKHYVEGNSIGIPVFDPDPTLTVGSIHTIDYYRINKKE
jgi:hypothetical protein